MFDPLLVYSVYVVALLSLLFNLFQYWLRRKDNELVARREKRYEVYKEYLSKLDSASSRLYQAQASEEVMEGWSTYFEKLLAGEDIVEEFGRLIMLNFESTRVWMMEQNKLLEEINAVRLVGGTEVNSLLDEYTQAVQSLKEATASLPFEIIAGGPGHFPAETAQAYGSAYESLEGIRSKLHTAMRKDIGIE